MISFMGGPMKKSHNSNGRPKGSGCGPARPLTSTEVKILFGSINGKRGSYYRAMIAFGLYAGFRCSTITGLTRGDVITNGKCRDFICLSKHRQKNKRSKRYPIAKAGIAIIQEYIDTMSREEQLDSEKPLFPSYRGGGFIPKNSASRMITNLIKSAGLEQVSSHSLRKGFSLKLLTAGYGLETIKTALDHKHLSTTLHYLGNIQPKANTAVLNLNY
tara:strand:- start:292 stop:939 length:648 start_codon:yes stop_codon:yes gene_type:complete